MQVGINTKGEKAIRRIGEEQENGSTEKGPAGEPGRRAQEHRENRYMVVKKGSGGGAGSGDDRKRARETEAAGKGKAAGKARRQGAATVGERGGMRKQGQQRETEAAGRNGGGRGKSEAARDHRKRQGNPSGAAGQRCTDTPVVQKKADPGRVRRRNKLKTESERREQGSVGVRTSGTGDCTRGAPAPTAAHSTRSMQTAP